VNGHRSLLGFVQKFYLNTLFKCVKVLQVQDRIERTCDFPISASIDGSKRVFLSRYCLILNITPPKVGG